MKKKVLGLLMAAVLCLCLLPVGAAVDGDVTVKYDGVDEASGNIKREPKRHCTYSIRYRCDVVERPILHRSRQRDHQRRSDRRRLSGRRSDPLRERDADGQRRFDPHRRHQVFHLRADAAEYRSEMVWLILRLMLGSLYAIVYGAVNLTVPLPPMSLVTFDAPAFLLGVAILLGLELLRGRMEAGPAAGKERIAHEH